MDVAALKATWDFVNGLGLPGLLVVVAVAGWRRWWVFGWLYDDMRKDRDEWKALASRREDDAERAATFIVEQAARLADRDRRR